MDNSDQRAAGPSASGGGGSAENFGDWRVQLSSDMRQRIVNKIMGVIRKQVPGEEGLEQLRRIAVQFEDKVYASAKSQPDYMRRITVKMLSIEAKAKNNTTHHLTSSSPADSGSNSVPSSMHFQGPSQGQSLPVSLPMHQSQLHQQMSPQNIKNEQSSQLHQQMSPQNIKKEQSLPVSIQFSQPQLHHQMSLQNIQNNLESVGSLTSAGISSTSSHIPGLSQTPTINLSGQHINVHQMSSFSQNAERTSTGQGVALNDFPNYQELMQRRRSLVSQLQRQRDPHNNHQQNLYNKQLQLLQQQNLLLPTQQQSMSQQPGLLPQKPLLGQLPRSENRQQNQLVVQENRSEDLHNNQQLLGSLSGNSGLQTNQHSVHMLQQSAVPGQQQTSSSSHLLPSSKPSPLSDIQSQTSQFSQQMVLQQKTSQLQQNMQQRSQQAGSFLEQPNVINKQKQLYQSQSFQPETSTLSVDSKAQPGEQITEEMREQVYQKMKTMKDLYLRELNDMYQAILTRTQQQPQSLDQMRKLMMYKEVLERSMAFIQIPKSQITLRHKERLAECEKYITSCLSANKLRRPGQSPTQMMQQQQQPQPQIIPLQSHENSMNSQLQLPNSQNSMPAMQQNTTNLQQTNITSLLQNSMSTASTQQSLINSMQQSSSSRQGTAINSLQQDAGGSSQLKSVSSDHANINLSSQSGINLLQQSTNSLHSSLNLIQHQHLKHQQDEQRLQTQVKNQIQQRQMQQQSTENQQILQHHQLPEQMKTQEMSNIHQINGKSDMILEQMGVKPGNFQPPSGQHPPHQQPLQNASSQNMQYSSLPTDQQDLFNKAGTPLQSATSLLVLSPSTPKDPSPTPGASDGHIPAVPMHSNAINLGSPLSSTVAATPQSHAIGSPVISASPMLKDNTNHDDTHGNASGTASGHSNEQPIEQLIRAVQSISTEAANAAAADIASVFSMIDRNSGSAPGNGSKAAVGEDLVAMTNSRLQARNCLTQDIIPGARKMRRFFSATPCVASYDSLYGRFKQTETCDLEASPTSSAKRPKIVDKHALLEEIKHINQRLIDTSITVSDEDNVNITSREDAAENNNGTIVKCSYNAVALGPHLKSHYFNHLFPIQPLLLFIPSDYPNSSPQFLEKFPIDVSNDCEDLSLKAKSRFGMSIRSLEKPWSLGEIVKTWDSSTHGVIHDYAIKRGGGNFSSRYGTWERC